MASFNPTWTAGYDRLGRFFWYNKVTGGVHRPLQSTGHGPHRLQMQQGLSMISGQQIGCFDACAQQLPEAAGSYYNPLAADMALWGILIQPPRKDGSRRWCGDPGWRRMTRYSPRGLEQKKIPKLPTPRKSHQERTRGRPALDGSVSLPLPVGRLRKAATR